MKNFRIFYFLVPAFLIAGEIQASEIPGTVSEIQGDEVTIVTDSKILPNRGDNVTIYFVLPGTQDEISVGAGKVSAVDAGAIKAKIENAAGEVAKNQKARITSDYPTDQTAVLNSGTPVDATSVPTPCSYLPGSVMQWDQASQKNTCVCPDGYEWNKARTGCRFSKAVLFQWANCGRLAGSTPVWQEDNERVFCQCPPGTAVNADGTACVFSSEMQLLAQTDCSMYPGTVPAWDRVTQRPGCTCPAGLQWNGTSCIPSAQPLIQPSAPPAQPSQSSGQPSDDQALYLG